ncbi:MAG: tetratricopeptide repeat protein [Acidobacteria bacterium]|nr:tetratricopeptide repeat protein [Acidobacteriota bacterium]
MKSDDLVKAGQLDEAVAWLSARLRDNPGDVRARTSLFELLCYQGDYDRAEKHLSVLGEGNKDTQVGALLYHGAMHAERLRRDLFVKQAYPAPLAAEAAQLTGTLNGKPFTSLQDSDPRIGPRIEVFGAGDYFWIPLAQIQKIEIEAPKRLRDLMWIPARVTTAPGFQQRELGEVLLPALNPLTWQHPDAEVRLGRVTEWCAGEQGDEHPYGLKMLVVDGEEVPILEVRKLEIAGAAAEAASGS